MFCVCVCGGGGGFGIQWKLRVNISKKKKNSLTRLTTTDLCDRFSHQVRGLRQALHRGRVVLGV